MWSALPLEIFAKLPQSRFMTQPLRLLAHSKADIDVMSAVLQDAALTVGDMTYLPNRRRFAIVANRFMWEDHHKSGSANRKKRNGRRKRTGLHFDDVHKAEIRHIPRERKDHVLSLLAVTVTDREDGTAHITLDFAGGGTVRLQVECINASLMDMGESWPALRTPHHDPD